MSKFTEWTRVNNERALLGGRWFLALFCLVMTAVLAKYVISSAVESIHNILHFSGSIESQTLEALEVLDAMMVANVIYLITVGSYLVFVKPRLDDKVIERYSERPAAFNELNPGVLKERMAASLISISAINLIAVLLRAGTPDGNIDYKTLIVKGSLHILLMIGLLLFYYVSREETNGKEDSHSPGSFADPISD